MRWILTILLLFLPIFCDSGNRSTHRSTGIVLLDFNGYHTEEILYSKHDFKSTYLSQDERIEVQKGVVGYFRDFDVTITTDDELFYSYPENKRVRCVITDDTISVFAGFYISTPAGISPYNSLYLGDTTCSIVSIPMTPYHCIASVIAHEVGHTLGLAHQSRWVKLMKTEEYRIDSVIGAIMGDVCGCKYPIWWKGTNSFGQYQDDKEIIARTFPLLGK